MSATSVPVYSDVCNTDRDSYIAFCASLIAYHNGSGAVRNNEELLGVDDGADHGGRDYVGECPLPNFRAIACGGSAEVAVPVFIPAVGCDNTGDCDSRAAAPGGEESAVGAPDGDAGVAGGGLDRARSDFVAVSHADTTGPQGGLQTGLLVKGCRPGETLKERNKRWSADRKARKLRKQGSVASVVAETSLQRSSREKWEAQNNLATLRAERERKVLESSDVAFEVRRYRAKVIAATEGSMVRIGKTHKELGSSGDVTPELDHDVRTVLSESSVSPGSSASQAEFQAVRIELLNAVGERDEEKKKK